MTTTEPADMAMMWIIHRAFRRDLARLARLAETTTDAAGRRALREGWELVRTQLHLHHTGEDERLWPAVRARLAPGAAQRQLLDEMEREHARLDPLIRRVDETTAVSGDPATAAQALRELSTALDDHLTREEEQVVPLIESLLTAEDLKDFEAQQKRKLGLRGAAVFFPWLLDGLDDQRTRTVLSQLPPPLRLLAKTRWRKAYARQHGHWTAPTQAAS